MSLFNNGLLIKQVT